MSKKPPFPPSPRVRVHASAVVLADAARPFGGPEDAAVLLLGEPGSGKSDVALRLIAGGARLIADDQTDLFVRDGRLFAAAPAGRRGFSEPGMLEIRGAGIVRLKAAGPAPVALAVALAPEGAPQRLPLPRSYVLPGGLEAAAAPPLAQLPAFQASTPAKIAALASAAATGRFVAGMAEGGTRDGD